MEIPTPIARQPDLNVSKVTSSILVTKSRSDWVSLTEGKRRGLSGIVDVSRSYQKQ